MVLVDVVVVVTAHAAPTHASQQLATAVAHALPPAGATHAAAERFGRQLVRSPLVRQHETQPGLPQVERAAQRVTAERHAAGSVPSRTCARATLAAHRTHVACVGTPAQSQFASTSARAATTAAGSSQEAAASPRPSRKKMAVARTPLVTTTAAA